MQTFRHPMHEAWNSDFKSFKYWFKKNWSYWQNFLEILKIDLVGSVFWFRRIFLELSKINFWRMFYETLIFVSKYVSNVKIKIDILNCEILFLRRAWSYWISMTTENFTRQTICTEHFFYSEPFLRQDLNKISRSISLILLLFVFEMSQIKLTHSTDLSIHRSKFENYKMQRALTIFHSRRLLKNLSLCNFRKFAILT